MNWDFFFLFILYWLIETEIMCLSLPTLAYLNEELPDVLTRVLCRMSFLLQLSLMLEELWEKGKGRRMAECQLFSFYQSFLLIVCLSLDLARKSCLSYDKGTKHSKNWIFIYTTWDWIPVFCLGEMTFMSTRSQSLHLLLFFQGFFRMIFCCVLFPINLSILSGRGRRESWDVLWV